MIHQDSLFIDVQDHIKGIYCKNNDLLHSKRDMVIHLLRASTIILKKVRRNKLDDVPRKIASAFAWTLSIASRLHRDLGYQVYWHFPNVCPYSGTKPHQSRTVQKGRIDLTPFRQNIPQQTVAEAQIMLREIYPNNKLMDSAQHLVEEIAELIIALTEFGGTHDQKSFDEVQLELVDAVAHLFAIASCMELNLIDLMIKHFGEGCPECKSPVCSCTFSDVARSC